MNDPPILSGHSTKTDAGKIAEGNTAGSKDEKRINLNLGKDYWHILSEADYLSSRREDGAHPRTTSHQTGQTWHYFIDQIYYKEDDNADMNPMAVIINVREASNGAFVYAFETYYHANVNRAFQRKRTPANLVKLVTRPKAPSLPALAGRIGADVSAEDSSSRTVSQKDDKSKTKFSLDSEAEERGDLVAVHNIGAKNLLDADKLGGFAMPSIAVMKARTKHAGFGEISLLFDKDTVE